MADPQVVALRKLLTATPDCASTRPQKLSNALQAFVSVNEDAASSPNYQSSEPDDLDIFIALVSLQAVKENAELLLRLLKCMKILTRKYDNRVRLGEHIVEDLVEVLHDRVSIDVAAEASNVVLNICYERENVVRLVHADGVPPLVQFASDNENADLQAFKTETQKLHTGEGWAARRVSPHTGAGVDRRRLDSLREPVGGRSRHTGARGEGRPKPSEVDLC